jgi:hypothetical protein
MPRFGDIFLVKNEPTTITKINIIKNPTIGARKELGRSAEPIAVPLSVPMIIAATNTMMPPSIRVAP